MMLTKNSRRMRIVMIFMMVPIDYDVGGGATASEAASNDDDKVDYNHVAHDVDDDFEDIHDDDDDVSVDDGSGRDAIVFDDYDHDAGSDNDDYYYYYYYDDDDDYDDDDYDDDYMFKNFHFREKV
ncbi:hypothetical protein DPMN_169119 [Dreissena polymorpha]|uniref:Uncharacterized protein n=1 Tax=Dreissena polymorpha TaxID=45954 RepID=A0A9D4IWJ8_DREPO|nr:hypothetical protein DPMN_169119 [Dreissena polymorpha]